MNLGDFIDTIPLWLVFVGTIALVLLCLTLGNFFGQRLSHRVTSDSPVNAVTSAHLALLAFFLAFTFNLASGHFDDRNRLLLREVNAIAVAAFQADLVADRSLSATTLELLREYVELRASMTLETIGQGVARSAEIHALLKREIERAAAVNGLTLAQSKLADAITTMINVQNDRVAAAFKFQIPKSIWPSLYAILVFSMVGLGYSFGIKNSRNPVGNLALALSFSTVLYLIADLDRPFSGRLVTDQTFLEMLDEQLAED